MDVLVIVLCGAVHVGLARASVRHGWPVLALGTAVQAMREIRDRSPRLVVVQVSTLSSEPLKLIRMLRHCSQPVLVLAVANSHRTQLEKLVRDAGASCYLPAAEEEDQLAQTVASMLDYLPCHVATGTSSGPIVHLDPPLHLTRRGSPEARR
jgi:DNA-binding NarL/FixJ family response regulator